MASDGLSVSSKADSQRNVDSDRIAGRLKLYFAMLSCLGGMVLGTGNETESVTVIAVFFAVFGYVFVDWLELFALPPLAAYAAMAVAALYCVSDFADLDSPGNRQMIAVGQLLVFVQAILMLQRKSRRILEQLGVFCLLQLIVAAVFNNAINYGLLLIPISIIGAWALCLLSAVSAWDGLQESPPLADDAADQSRSGRAQPIIQVSSPESVRSVASTAKRLPRVALFALAPSVMLVGAIFFYALPRTADATRITGQGSALIGFSDQLHLGQIGDMMQSTAPALRIYVQRDGTGQPYNVIGGMYLRGRVLEEYTVSFNGSAAGTWRRYASDATSEKTLLPAPFYPRRLSDRNFYDTVNFDVTCESMRSAALFSVAPYHRRRNDTEILHSPSKWTISRREDGGWVYPRLAYSFGSNAFRDGVQNDLVARYETPEKMLAASDNRSARSTQDYLDKLLEYDEDRIPTAERLARGVVAEIPETALNDFRVAKRLESYLASRGGFRYTIRLDSEEVPGMDPLEQFLAVDQKGHCQYFASALAMMLRSQGIPSRVVVGYHTDEYNELGQYYVARQLHAHAWVEALIHRDELPNTRAVYGQSACDEYWLRLDPTPGGGGVSESEAGGVGQVFDLAQNIWDDYVVEMDGTRQDDALLNTPGLSPMSDSYTRLIDNISQRLAQIRSGELGGGALASRQLFSWPAAVLGVILTLGVLVITKFRMPGWIKKTIRRKIDTGVERPSIPFYAQALDQLARVGLIRRPAQTPAELAREAEHSLHYPPTPSLAEPLRVLTTEFYDRRFGSESALVNDVPTEPGPAVDEALRQLTDRVDQMAAKNVHGEERRS